MQRIAGVAYLWPGLPELWYRGQWFGLFLAVFATLLVNVLLASTLVWTEWLPGSTRLTLTAMLALTWGAGIYGSRKQARLAARRQSVGAGEDLFQQAQNEYLKGNWFESEAVIHKLLRSDARDVDAHLMLATLFRHTGRLEESDAQLRRLALFDDAAKWTMEIERERHLLELAREERSSVSGDGEADRSQCEEESTCEQAARAA